MVSPDAAGSGDSRTLPTISPSVKGMPQEGCSRSFLPCQVARTKVNAANATSEMHFFLRKTRTDAKATSPAASCRMHAVVPREQAIIRQTAYSPAMQTQG
jgi:hypothetical protein